MILHSLIQPVSFSQNTIAKLTFLG